MQKKRVGVITFHNYDNYGCHPAELCASEKAARNRHSAGNY